ncbi:MAG: hypothetical protein WA789_18105 [Candidatus Acidiferrum sp.]
MNTLARSESLPSVTAAGVVAILFGVFGVLGSLLAALSMMLMPDIQTAQGAPPMPPEVRTMSAVIMLFMLALSVFGIFVGIGIIRRRNWARITILVWAGFMAFVCLCAIAFSFVIFSAMPAMQLPNINAADTGHVMHFVSLFLAFFYGVPAAVGIWWIVLFTRKRVAAAFTNPALSSAVMDPSGFPQLLDTAAVQQRGTPACPLPLAILAGLLAFGALFVALFSFVPLPSGVPFVLFGHAFAGPTPRIVLFVFGVLSGVTAVGIFKLKPWALYTQIVFQFLGALNCIIAAFSPAYPSLMRAAIEKMYSQNPVLMSGSPFMSDSYFRSIMLLSTLMVAAVLAILIWQRPRFLVQAAAAAAVKT